MTTNTQQEKARFFAGYLNQQVLFDDRIGNIVSYYLSCGNLQKQVWVVSLEDEDFEHNELSCSVPVEKCSVLLTPLSEISNEDLIQAAKIAHGTSFLNPKCKWEVDIDTEYGFKTLSAKESYHSFDFDTTYGTISMYDGDNPSGSSINHYGVFQYLQQKGYALPWYSAELGRVIEVEEQVSLGWVKLKGGEK